MNSPHQPTARLSYQESGSGDTTLVLIPGQGGNAADWDDEFLQLISTDTYRIIRIDNRDSGQSQTFDDLGVPNPVEVWTGRQRAPYSLEDMANDLVALLQTLGVQKAHLVGRSLGAMIAQCVATRNPGLVAGLVLISGTTGSRLVGQSTPEVAKELASTPTAVSADPIGQAVRSALRFASSSLGVTADEVRTRMQGRFQRGYSRSGASRQLAAVLDAPDRTETLSAITAPTAVIHGTNDPLIDPSGSEATARAIPGATLTLVEGMGHDLPRPAWPIVMQAIAQVVQKAHRPAVDLASTDANTLGIARNANP